MTTKTQKIIELKAQYPTLSKGINDEIFQLDADEYEKTISRWAEVELAQEAAAAAAEAKAQAKAELLERLGITEDEAKLLLS
jgi:hypothetical protein